MERKGREEGREREYEMEEEGFKVGGLEVDLVVVYERGKT